MEVIMEMMERRSFLKFTLGVAAVAAGTAAVTRAEAMPVMAPVEPPRTGAEEKPTPAVATADDVNSAKPETVQWRWRRRWYWRRRRWWWR
jgi:hypothetical protein